MNLKRWFPLTVALPAALLSLLAACVPPSAAPSAPGAATIAAATSTSAPTEPDAPAPTAASTIAPAAAPIPASTPETVAVTPPAAEAGPGLDLAPQVRALFVDSLGYELMAADAGAPGITDVVVFALQPPAGWPPLWVAHTVGLRNFETDQPHTIALYAQAGETATEAARLVLRGTPDSPDALAPDYLGEGGVTQQQIEPSALWLSVEGGVGAHSGVYGLLRYDGVAITPQIGAFSSSPGVGSSRDLNGDGILEVIIDTGDPYVFCYACGVRLPGYALWRWDGATMVQVELAELPVGAPEALRSFNARLLQLAQGGLWMDVHAMLAEAASMEGAGASDLFAWNALLLQLNADARRIPIEAEEPAYPLLAYVFYGDYAGAVALMRPYTAQEIFSLASPLIVETVAEGWEETLASWIHRFTADALTVQPDLAPAHFLAGWAAFLVGDRAEAQAAVQRAAELAPEDALFTQSLALLEDAADKDEATLTALQQLNVRSGPGLSYPVIGALEVQALATVTGQFGAGQDHWWQIVWAGAESGGWVSADPLLAAVEEGDEVPRVVAPALVGDVAPRGRIFYSQTDSEGIAAIYSVEVVAGAEALLVVSEARLPALQPGGETLAFASTRADMLGLGGVDLRSGERLRYTFNVEDMLPRWNRAGDRLLFSSTRHGDRKPRVYHVWADGAGSAEDVGFGQDADWLPGSGRIIFKGCNDVGEACGLWSMADDGSERISLTSSTGDSRPRWSADGAYVYFMSDGRDGNWELYRLDIAGGAILRLTDDPALDGLPAVSPDGSAIAFVTNRSGAWELVTVPAAGGEVTVIRRLGEDFPNWLDHGLDWTE